MNGSPSKNYTLSQLSKRIKDLLNEQLEISYWVVAEIAEIKVNAYSGHCYLELVEKEDDGDQVSARMKGNIWASTYRMLSVFFENSTGMSLQTGMKILVRGVVEYHEVYGISLNIRDVDPAFTVGELAIKKQQVLDLLVQDRVIDMNKEIDFPILPKRVAVISSENAAGYRDFINQLNENKRRYTYHIKLFPAIMQGEKASDSIIEALNRIYDHLELFDVVVIIRGGGAVLDLNCFNDYDLCYTAAQFPLPLLTGIGHEKDETVLDLVAYQKLKTPTAVAEFLIQIFKYNEEQLESITNQIKQRVTHTLVGYRQTLELAVSTLTPNVNAMLNNERTLLDFQTQSISGMSKRFILAKRNDLNRLSGRMRSGLQYTIRQESKDLEVKKGAVLKSIKMRMIDTRRKLNELSSNLEYQDPRHILQKGYTLTSRNGEIIRSSQMLNKGDKLKTIFNDGSVSSSVD